MPQLTLRLLGAPQIEINGRGVETERRKAIALAVGMAKPGDVVVIAGKGHENYQIVGDQTFPFDDVQVAGEEIKKCSAV